MRPLTEDEMKQVLQKLTKYLGSNVMQLVDRKDELFVFRLHKERVFYMSEKILKMSGCVPRKQLLLAGTCLGKFTKTRKFYLSVTCLDYLARFAKCKMWLKNQGEQAFLYGNHVIKRHIGRITEGACLHEGVVVYSMQSDIPIGFGVLAKSLSDIRSADAEAIVVFHQADVGEYLRHEADLI